MSEFKIIESQEQLDSIIKDRLQRKEESVRKELEEKYAEQLKDYEDIKKAHEELTNNSNSFQETINKLTNERDENAKTIEGLNAQLKQREMDTLKQNIAYEYGLPLEMASRLNGEDEESLRKDASALASFVSAKPSPPRKSSENRVKSDDGYKNLVRAFSHE